MGKTSAHADSAFIWVEILGFLDMYWLLQTSAWSEIDSAGKLFFSQRQIFRSIKYAEYLTVREILCSH